VHPEQSERAKDPARDVSPLDEDRLRGLVRSGALLFEATNSAAAINREKASLVRASGH
jgi:hypothetical protein